jgi:hypothetical protein
MKKYAFAALLAAIGLAACHPEPPPPPPPPPSIDISGQLREKAGACATIMGDNGTAYAVHGDMLGTIPVGSRIHVVGVVDPKQDCPGRTLIRPDGGITMLAPPPRRRYRGHAPK